MVAVLITITPWPASPGRCGSDGSPGPIAGEVATTPNIALPGLALVLMSTLASETVGQLRHHRTGRWNPKNLGHDA